MISAKKKTIDGSEYMVTQMTARQALKMQAKLLKLLGPCLGEAISAMLTKDDKTGLSRSLMALASTVDEKTFDGLVFELLVGVRKDGVELRDGEINLEFAGALNTLYKVIAFVLEANYSDFWAEGGIIHTLAALLPAEKPAFPSNDSTQT